MGYTAVAFTDDISALLTWDRADLMKELGPLLGHGNSGPSAEALRFMQGPGIMKCTCKPLQPHRPAGG